MSKSAVETLKSYCLAHGAPSDEAEVRELFTKKAKGPGIEISHDRLGGVLASKSSKSSKSPRVLITAHMDEVGFAVQNITPEGFVQVVPLGGWWTHNLLSQRLSLKNSKGKKFTGVISSIPPHFLSEAERTRVLDLDKLFVDFGASSDKEIQGKWGIDLGDTLVPEPGFQKMANPKIFCSKAFDNRVGMAVMSEAFDALKNKSLGCQLLAAATVQEELGLRGAKTMAALAKPDIAFVLEGPPADDTPKMNRNEAQGKLSGGPQVRLLDPTAVMSRPLIEYIKSTAKKAKIPIQLTVRRSGGTDAGSFHLSGEGVACVVIGVPARYIHTHNSMIHEDDYLKTIKLIQALVSGLNDRTAKNIVSF